MTTRSPTQIGRFQIQAQLGAGAFGVVYRAHDPQLDRPVALKVPHASTLANPGAIERFLREAKAAAGLHHPHIVPVYAAGHDGAHYYIASAFIDGHSLAHAIENGALGGRQAARIVHDLAEALAYAHNLGIIHRDVKPANVMLDAHGTAYLMDFGLAHRHEEAAKLTQDGTLLGTPAYMAPEQAQGQRGEPLPASDQYSLGVVLYELLTGQTPFSGPAQIVLFNAIHKEPPAPRTIKAQVPRDLETICLKALTKKPEDRYATCQELADDLQRWLEGEPIQARPLGVAERLVRWGVRNPALALAGAAAALCLTAAAVAASASAVHAATLRQRAADARRVAEEGRQAASAARREAEQAEQDEAKARDDADKQRTLTKAALAKAEEVKKKQKKTLQDLEATNAIGRQEQARLAKAKIAAGEAGTKADAARRVTDIQLQARCGSNVAFSPDGKQVALGSGGELLLWDTSVDTTRAEKRVKMSSTVTGVAFDPTGKFLAVASADRKVTVHELPTLQVHRTYTQHRGDINALAFSPDGRFIASAGKRNPSEASGLRVWLAATGVEPVPFQGHDSPILSLAYSSDGNLLASGDEAETVKVWDARTGKALRTLDVGRRDNPPRGLAFSRDAQLLARAGKNVRIWDVKSDNLIRSLEGQRIVAYSPDGRYLATSLKSEIVLYAVATYKEVKKLTGHGNGSEVMSVAFSPDGTRLVSVSTDDTVRLWDVSLAEQPATTPKQ